MAQYLVSAFPPDPKRSRKLEWKAVLAGSTFRGSSEVEVRLKAFRYIMYHVDFYPTWFTQYLAVETVNFLARELEREQGEHDATIKKLKALQTELPKISGQRNEKETSQESGALASSAKSNPKDQKQSVTSDPWAGLLRTPRKKRN